MSDLLKEAIADAKAVRETALQNAKMALEEAFTPHLKSMLSAKLSEEDLEEDEDFQEGMHDDEEDDEKEIEDEGMHDSDRMGREDDDDEEENHEEGYGSDRPSREDDDDEKEVDESEIVEIDGVKYAPIVSEDEVEEGMHDSDRKMGREDDDDEEEVDESEIVEIDGVKYAPIVSEEDEEEGDDDEDEKEDDMDEGEELDLEAVIKELEEELEEAGDPGDEEESVNEEEVTEGDEEEIDEEVVNEDEEDLEEQSTSSGIGKGSGVKQASASDEEDPGKGKIKESVEAIQNELNEYKEAVVYLKDKLHEVNILNAKLLYTNKLFKEFVLSNDQKLKIVETFDRAQTTREIKLVYSTLAESYKDNGGERKEVVKESYASKKSGGTAPKTKIITEEVEVADRFRKLAGLKS